MEEQIVYIPLPKMAKIKPIKDIFALPSPYDDSSINKIIFPGSFNPVHDGHITMALWAAKTFQTPISFEISCVNVDKPDLNYDEIQQRYSGFQPYSLPKGCNVVVTNAPRFLDKVKLFPNSIFLVGYDTFNRLVNLNYYNNDLNELNNAIDTFVEYKANFIVFHRQGVNLTTLDNNSRLIDIIKLVDESEYLDSGISSSKIREGIQ